MRSREEGKERGGGKGQGVGKEGARPVIAPPHSKPSPLN